MCGRATWLRCGVIVAFLVDTSAWIRHFSSKDHFDLRTVCGPEERVLCLPVYQEILQGVRDEGSFRRIRDILNAAEWVEDPLGREVHAEAVDLFRSARQQGLTIRSSVDCLIAACAIRHDLTVLHHDRDYASLASVSLLKQRAV